MFTSRFTLWSEELDSFFHCLILSLLCIIRLGSLQLFWKSCHANGVFGCVYSHTKLIGIKFKFQWGKGFECYADVPMRTPFVVTSWSDWCVFYVRYPVVWASKMQTMVALCTINSVFISIQCSLQCHPNNGTCRRIEALQVWCLWHHSLMYSKIFQDNVEAIDWLGFQGPRTLIPVTIT